MVFPFFDRSSNVCFSFLRRLCLTSVYWSACCFSFTPSSGCRFSVTYCWTQARTSTGTTISKRSSRVWCYCFGNNTFVPALTTLTTLPPSMDHCLFYGRFNSRLSFYLFIYTCIKTDEYKTLPWDHIRARWMDFR